MEVEDPLDTEPMAHRTLWIARHGSRLDFVDPDWARVSVRIHDPPLSPQGILQARALARRLVNDPVDRVVASPFLRAVETAHLIAEELELPVDIECGICEWLNPNWFSKMPQWLPLAELADQFPRINPDYTCIARPDEFESWDRMILRTGEVMRGLLARSTDNLLVVAHGASLIGCTYGLLGHQIDINADFCALVKLIDTPLGWNLALSGDTAHLQDPLDFPRQRA